MFEVVKGMYELPQAGLLAQQRLIAHLAKANYVQSAVIPCLFRHLTNGATFVLVVDDFGVKFQNTQGRDHFSIPCVLCMPSDYEGSQYLGMSIAHDKTAQTISISMPGYVARVLERFHELAGTRTASTPAVYHAIWCEGADSLYGRLVSLIGHGYHNPASHYKQPLVLCACCGSYNVASCQCHRFQPGAPNNNGT